MLKLGSVTTGKTLPDVSVSKDICDQFGFQQRKTVIIEKVEPENGTIEFIEVTFINQYLSRSDMLKLKLSLVKSCAYVGQKVLYACSKVKQRRTQSRKINS